MNLKWLIIFCILLSDWIGFGLWGFLWEDKKFRIGETNANVPMLIFFFMFPLLAVGALI